MPKSSGCASCTSSRRGERPSSAWTTSRASKPCRGDTQPSRCVPATRPGSSSSIVGTRNVFATRPVTNMEEMKGLSIRMQGAPIWTSVFNALGAAPTVIAYNAV